MSRTISISKVLVLVAAAGIIAAAQEGQTANSTDANIDASAARQAPADEPESLSEADSAEPEHPAEATFSSTMVAGSPAVEPQPDGGGLEGEVVRAPILDSNSSKLSFQAFLTDTQGDPLPGASVDLEFNLYTSGGGLIQGPIILNAVPMSEGVVDTQVPVSANSFDGTGRELGVKINGGPEMSPRMKLTTVPYAFRVDRVENAELTDNVELGSASAAGSLNAFGGASFPAATIQMMGAGSRISTYGTGGAERIRLWGPSWGEMLLMDSVGAERTVLLTAGNDTGGSLTISNNTGITTASIYNGNFFGIPLGGQLATYDEAGTLTAIFGSSVVAGGYINLLQADGGVGAVLEGDNSGAGLISVKNINNTTTITLDGDEGDLGGDLSLSDGTYTTIEIDPSRGGGGAGVILSNGNGLATLSIDADSNDSAFMDLRNAAGTATIQLDADEADDAAVVTLRDGNGTRIELDADGTSGGAELFMRNSSSLITVAIDADENDSGEIELFRNFGAFGIGLYADYNGRGRVVTQELEITGGSDLSEQFDVRSGGGSVEPGMVVSIDPAGAGKLMVSTEPYDRRVAGILSGAGGVQPGMMMGQFGTPASGEHAVALTGRVYCFADAAYGPIEPGDRLTTSRTPGHAMKAVDHVRAHGAVIGKAMTGLSEGRGLVLVLVQPQ